MNTGNGTLSSLLLTSLSLLISLLFLVIILACVSRKRKREHAKELFLQRMKMITAYDGVVDSFAGMLDMKSEETGGHVRRVAEYTACLCRNLGMAPDLIHDISVASMMHDVGKMLVPKEILEKTGKLTEEDLAEIRRHVIYGEHVLEKADNRIMKLAGIIAGEHHEHWDGTGYARGKKGEEISLPARIVAVADVFDALTGHRSYKEPWTPEAARAEIIAMSGSQFDPKVVEAFIKSYPEFLEILEEHMPDTGAGLRSA